MSNAFFTDAVVSDLYHTGTVLCMELGRKLEAIRNEKGLSRPQVAQRMGVSEQTIYRKERGGKSNKRGLKAEEIPFWARALEVTVDYIYSYGEKSENDDLLKGCGKLVKAVIESQNMNISDEQYRKIVSELAALAKKSTSWQEQKKINLDDTVIELAFWRSGMKYAKQ